MATLPFLDRGPERGQLEAALAQPAPSLSVLWGRRRCGKTRLLREVLRDRPHVYWLAGEGDPRLHRRALAQEIERHVETFAAVEYPDWQALLARANRELSPGTVLAIDELPNAVASCPGFAVDLQRLVDDPQARVHLVVAGSSQRMMQGLVLDRAAPLWGRARAVLRISPLPCGWIADALRLRSAVDCLESYAVWGGIPRYWELARSHAGWKEAARELILSPLGVLYDEPDRLLRDDLREPTGVQSLLQVIGSGAHRLSEIAARLDVKATSLSVPLARLIELDLIRRELPFGESSRSTKRTRYVIADPFLRFWHGLVAPRRSLLEAGRADLAMREITERFPHHAGSVWEDLARASVSHLTIGGRRWRPANRWWGTGIDHRPLEIDVVAESDDRRAVLVGEAKWSGKSPSALLAGLEEKGRRLPFLGKREIVAALWLATARSGSPPAVVTARSVLQALR